MKKFLIALMFMMAQMLGAQTLESCDPAPNAATDKQTVERLRKLVVDKNFSALEDELGDRLKRYDAGQYSDLELYWLIKNTVSKADVSFDPILKQWVKERPQQLMARLVKAEYHIAMAYAKRGKEFAEETSAEQMQAMNAEFEKAAQEIKVAMDISSKSSLVRATLMEIIRARGGREAARMLYMDAQEADPLNQSVRWAAISALDQRWGGRPEDMEWLLDQFAKSPLSPSRKRALQWKVEMIRAQHFQNITKEKTKAIAQYRKAATICDSSDVLWQMSRAANDLEDWPVVVEVMTSYLTLKSDESRPYTRRGWALEKQGKLPEATADYQKAADLGDAWAQNKLGYMYAKGQGVTKDIPRARQLLQAAAAQGNTNAQAHLQWLGAQKEQ